MARTFNEPMCRTPATFSHQTFMYDSSTDLAPVASSPASEFLQLEDIRATLRGAFAPHRCTARFRKDAFSGQIVLVLIVHVSGTGPTPPAERAFLVEAVPVQSLRRRDALSSYIDDVREQLQAHNNVTFAVTGRRRSGGS